MPFAKGPRKLGDPSGCFAILNIGRKVTCLRSPGDGFDYFIAFLNPEVDGFVVRESDSRKVTADDFDCQFITLHKIRTIRCPCQRRSFNSGSTLSLNSSGATIPRIRPRNLPSRSMMIVVGKTSPTPYASVIDAVPNKTR